MNSAHSAWPCFENVHDPTSVTCRRRRSWLTSSVTWPRSPTKQAVPHARTERTAATRASGAEEASSVLCAPSPWVSSAIAATMSCAAGSITSAAPLCGERNHERFNCEPLASSAHSRRQGSQQVQRLPALLGQALAGLDCRSLQRGQRGVLEGGERAGVRIATCTGC